jgi:hypothetical protein
MRGVVRMEISHTQPPKVTASYFAGRQSSFWSGIEGQKTFEKKRFQSVSPPKLQPWFPAFSLGLSAVGLPKEDPGVSSSNFRRQYSNRSFTRRSEPLSLGS